MKHLFFLCLFPIILFSKQILVVPDYEGYADTMFPKRVVRSNYGNYNVWGRLKCVLQEKGIKIGGSNFRKFLADPSLIDEVDKVIFVNIPGYIRDEEFDQFPKEKLILMMWEPPSVIHRLYNPKLHERFGQVYTWQDDLVDGRHYFKMHYPVLHQMRSDMIPFKQQKMLCAISRNKRSSYRDEIYSERVAAIEFFERLGRNVFDLFGYGWQTEGYRNYKGSIPDKYATLRKYRFSLCYENTQNIEGYVTEKIFDCFHVGCVPVYLGASNITRYVPKDCFIDKRNFTSYDELLDFLEKMDQTTHRGYVKRIRAYLKTKQARAFSDEAFIENLLAQIPLS
ncbi:MAG: glycosyltransferase family 10 [Simkaniaceae bacterium]|nr:glycosyltransferase family 10 [Simkaniaceae bacterium]